MHYIASDMYEGQCHLVLWMFLFRGVMSLGEAENYQRVDIIDYKVGP